RTGDYWLVPARTVTGDVEWPQSGGAPESLPPHGVNHRRCSLAIATSAGAGWTIVDCRDPFVPLNQVVSLFYLSGDGQTATPDPLNLAAFLPLPQNPTVGVSRGELPASGKNVRFTVTKGAGRIVGPAVVPTNADGIAACPWELGSVDGVQQLRAELLDSEGQPTHLPIVFTATLNKAEVVAYDPSGCPDLMAAQANTVQKALDILCRFRGSTGCCKSVGKGGDFETLEEAFKRLLEEKELGGICLCLMPGRHRWPSGLDFPARDVPLHLGLTGIRGASVIFADGEFMLQNLGVVAISDLSIEAEASAGFDALEELDVSNTRLFVRKRLRISEVRTAVLADVVLQLEGDAFIDGCDDVRLQHLVAQIKAADDALTIVRAKRLRIEGCRIDAALARFDNAAIRLVECLQTVIDGNELRARVRRSDVDNSRGLVETGGNFGELVFRLGESLRAADVRESARRLVGSSDADRRERIGEIRRFVSENGMRLGADGSEAVLRLSEALADANADERRVGDAISSLNERVIDANTDTGALSASFVPFGVALVMMDGIGQTRVSKNVVFGYVALYGNPGTHRIAEPVARVLAGRMKQGAQPWGFGMLHFSDNDLLGILLADEYGDDSSETFKNLMAGRIDQAVYKMMTISGNTFHLPPLEILGSAVTFTANVMNQNVEYAGIVLGHRATFTGNLAYGGMVLFSATQLTAEAANLSINIV
ncbi:MAG TPA: hypothetical protein VGE01_10815, partial [Fimbriimonas sp.]